jgi:hypothetical protein
MPSTANQYPRDFTARAELGSNIGLPSRDPFDSRQADDAAASINTRNREILQSLSRLDRESANPENHHPASTGGHLYPQTLNISSEQLLHAHSLRDPATRSTTNGHRTASTLGSLYSLVPQAPLGRSSTQSNNTLAALERQQAMPYLPTRGSSSASSDDPSAPAQYGRPAPSAPHPDPRRGQP